MVFGLFAVPPEQTTLMYCDSFVAFAIIADVSGPTVIVAPGFTAAPSVVKFEAGDESVPMTVQPVNVFAKPTLITGFVPTALIGRPNTNVPVNVPPEYEGLENVFAALGLNNALPPC
jgi:hypothetical protein